MKTRAALSISARCRRRPRPIVAIALLALGSQAGCGREFYREWANQDVTEAVYEKSRDPRYRLEVFSIEPPALARFAEPYDRDRPPAPPDDFAAQSLSPQPQWPDHRLLMPVEGTGYLKLLDEGPRYESPVIKKPAPVETKPKIALPPEPPIGPGPFGTPPANPNPATTPPGSAPSASRSNSGTNAAGTSPTSVVARPSPAPASSATRPASVPSPVPSTAQTSRKDPDVKRTAQQVPVGPMPTQTLPPQTDRQSRTAPTNPTDPLKTPRVPGDPNATDPDESKPPQGRPNTPSGEYRAPQGVEMRLAEMFVPDRNVPMDEAVAAGYPANSRPYVLTMEKAFQLGLINSRVYQFQLENIYINALPVTLQRFSFGPQFVAGLSPSTGIAGAGGPGGMLPAQNPANSFLYNTRATGSQLSQLNYGTVAGVGKLFDNGAKVLASFASQVVFNFVGKNPMQPTVKSFIPIQAMVPFLKGGGRAVTLEALTQAERSLLYSVRQFALFRQQFTVATLAGGVEMQFGISTSTGGFSAGSGNTDPTIGYLNVVEDVQLVENNFKNVSVFERAAEVYKDLINGENSGLTRLQLDQVNQQVQQARSTLISSQTQYRNDLDQFKIQLGMPPDVPLIIDRSRTRGFKAIFEKIDNWSLNPRRELESLDAIVADLPDLEDLIIDGRSAHEVFKDVDGSSLEDLLQTAVRISLENRLDLMNARAQLYDTWRQIRVSANALKGVLNVAVTNQFLTPPTTNNPFGFVQQAKDFSLVINAELPLVRVAERNTFLTQLINYERQRRTLQNTEDFLKYQLRNEIRQMQVIYVQYKIAERNLLLSLRIKDQSFEQIIAPPQPNVQANGATNTLNLINAQSSVINQENNLVSFWYNYQVQRLQVYRDLGILPIDEWEAFDEIFPPDRTGRAADVAIGGDGRPAVARTAQPTPAVGRR
jgi:hypothetical protein